MFSCGVAGYSGDLADSLETWSNGMAFSTFDHDNDRDISNNYANEYSGGFWFSACFRNGINAFYSISEPFTWSTGVNPIARDRMWLLCS